MFQAALQDLLRPSPDLLAGVLAWLCIVGLVYVFALPRAHNSQSAFLQVGFRVGVINPTIEQMEACWFSVLVAFAADGTVVTPRCSAPPAPLMMLTLLAVDLLCRALWQACSCTVSG